MAPRGGCPARTGVPRRQPSASSAGSARGRDIRRESIARAPGERRRGRAGGGGVERRQRSSGVPAGYRASSAGKAWTRQASRLALHRASGGCRQMRSRGGRIAIAQRTRTLAGPAVMPLGSGRPAAHCCRRLFAPQTQRAGAARPPHFRAVATNERRHRRTRSKRAWTSGAQGLCYDRAARTCGPHFERRSEKMPNIRQQEKRVRIAARQRLENLRYRSTIKTLVRRLQAAVADGDAEAVAVQHRALVRTIDKAAARGAIHRNTAARRKAQAARIVSGAS